MAGIARLVLLGAVDLGELREVSCMGEMLAVSVKQLAQSGYHDSDK